jgi:hypothetical protein
LSLFFVSLLWLGFAASATHNHDGGAKPASCAVCHVGAEPALDAPAEALLPETSPQVSASPLPLPARPFDHRRPGAVLGPRAPPA